MAIARIDSRCVCCGEIIPEGRQVCAMCEREGTLIFSDFEKARQYAMQCGWDTYKVLFRNPGFSVYEVLPEREGLNDKTWIADAICAEYCKYPDEYDSLYDDADEAIERCGVEKCEDCPLGGLRAR